MVTITELIEKLSPVVMSQGLELDDLKIAKSGKDRILEIVIDGNQVNLDQIAQTSREISAFLDESNVMGELPYTLEVTTRGVDSPILKPQHWQRNIGRLVSVVTDAQSQTGRIMSFDNPIVSLNINGSVKEINIEEISSAQIQIEFSKSSEFKE